MRTTRFPGECGRTIYDSSLLIYLEQPIKLMSSSSAPDMSTEIVKGTAQCCITSKSINLPLVNSILDYPAKSEIGLLNGKYLSA